MGDNAAFSTNDKSKLRLKWEAGFSTVNQNALNASESEARLFSTSNFVVSQHQVMGKRQ